MKLNSKKVRISLAMVAIGSVLTVFQNCGGYSSSPGAGDSVANLLSSSSGTGTTTPNPNPTSVTPPPFCQPSSSRSCNIANGVGSEMCNAAGSAYMECQRVSCNAGFKAYDKICIPNTMASGKWKLQVGNLIGTLVVYPSLDNKCRATLDFPVSAGGFPAHLDYSGECDGRLLMDYQGYYRLHFDTQGLPYTMNGQLWAYPAGATFIGP